MNIADQIPSMTEQQAALEKRINRYSTKIIDCDTEIARLEQKRLNLIRHRRELSLKLAEVSTFELDLK